MTVVPDEHLMTLICDSCGETTTGTACVLPDAEVVWTLVAEHGWSGSPFATGPHRCPPCSMPEPAAGARVATQGGSRRADDPARTAVGDLDSESTHELRAALQRAVDICAHVVVDLSTVPLIDAGGLALLVRAHRDARDRGFVLCLAAPSRFILTVLHTMRVDGLFPVFASREEAVRHLAAGGADDGPELAAVGAGPEPHVLPRQR